MKTTTKIALAICAGALMFAGRKPMAKAGSVIVNSLSQGDERWANKPVGNSAQVSKNIGCMVTAATAAANALCGRSMRVDEAIDMIVKADGFLGASLKLPTAMRALGCRQDDNARIRNSRNIPQLRSLIDDTLKNGGLAMVHVDYDLSTPMSNHFVVVYASDASGYKAMDPAGGKQITLDANLACRRTATKLYTATGVAPIFRA